LRFLEPRDDSLDDDDELVLRELRELLLLLLLDDCRRLFRLAELLAVDGRFSLSLFFLRLPNSSNSESDDDGRRLYSTFSRSLKPPPSPGVGVIVMV
jgi:hypothetical protein